MTQFTPTEKSRLMLYKISKGNPQAITIAIDEIKRLANEAISNTLADLDKKAIEAFVERLDVIQQDYQKELDKTLNSLEGVMEEVVRETMEARIMEVKPLKGDKGDRGDDGKKPTEAELLALIEPLIPYVKDGDDGKTPGREQLMEIVRPIVAETVENMKPSVDVEAEVEKKAKDMLEGMIKDEVAKKISEVKRFSGGGSGDRVSAGTGVTITTDVLGRKQISASGGFSVLTATGTVDDSNQTFTFTQKPTLIAINGAFYQENNGWTWSSPTATLDIPAGTGGSVFGIV